MNFTQKANMTRLQLIRRIEELEEKHTKAQRLIEDLHENKKMLPRWAEERVDELVCILRPEES